ncbi:MAG: hypothetical protein WBB25_03255 [Sulfitobacter sp.]
MPKYTRSYEAQRLRSTLAAALKTALADLPPSEFTIERSDFVRASADVS